MNSVTERDNAYKAIKEDGCQITVSQLIKGEYVPSDGSVTNTTKEYSTYGIITDYLLYEIDGTRVKAGDKKVVLGATSILPTPTPDDSLKINGETWSIVKCLPIMPAGIPILYRIQVRK